MYGYVDPDWSALQEQEEEEIEYDQSFQPLDSLDDDVNLQPHSTFKEAAAEQWKQLEPTVRPIYQPVIDTAVDLYTETLAPTYGQALGVVQHQVESAWQFKKLGGHIVSGLKSIYEGLGLDQESTLGAYTGPGEEMFQDQLPKIGRDEQVDVLEPYPSVEQGWEWDYKPPPPSYVEKAQTLFYETFTSALQKSRPGQSYLKDKHGMTKLREDVQYAIDKGAIPQELYQKYGFQVSTRASPFTKFFRGAPEPGYYIHKEILDAPSDEAVDAMVGYLNKTYNAGYPTTDSVYNKISLHLDELDTNIKNLRAEVPGVMDFVSYWSGSMVGEMTGEVELWPFMFAAFKTKTVEKILNSAGRKYLKTQAPIVAGAVGAWGKAKFVKEGIEGWKEAAEKIEKVAPDKIHIDKDGNQVFFTNQLEVAAIRGVEQGGAAAVGEAYVQFVDSIVLNGVVDQAEWMALIGKEYGPAEQAQAIFQTGVLGAGFGMFFSKMFGDLARVSAGYNNKIYDQMAADILEDTVVSRGIDIGSGAGYASDVAEWITMMEDAYNNVQWMIIDEYIPNLPERFLMPGSPKLWTKGELFDWWKSLPKGPERPFSYYKNRPEEWKLLNNQEIDKNALEDVAFYTMEPGSSLPLYVSKALNLPQIGTVTGPMPGDLSLKFPNRQDAKDYVELQALEEAYRKASVMYAALHENALHLMQLQGKTVPMATAAQQRETLARMRAVSQVRQQLEGAMGNTYRRVQSRQEQEWPEAEPEPSLNYIDQERANIESEVIQAQIDARIAQSQLDELEDSVESAFAKGVEADNLARTTDKAYEASTAMPPERRAQLKADRDAAKTKAREAQHYFRKVERIRDTAKNTIEKAHQRVKDARATLAELPPDPRVAAEAQRLSDLQKKLVYEKSDLEEITIPGLTRIIEQEKDTIIPGAEENLSKARAERNEMRNLGAIDKDIKAAKKTRRGLEKKLRDLQKIRESIYPTQGKSVDQKIFEIEQAIKSLNGPLSRDFTKAFKQEMRSKFEGEISELQLQKEKALAAYGKLEKELWPEGRNDDLFQEQPKELTAAIEAQAYYEWERSSAEQMNDNVTDKRNILQAAKERLKANKSKLSKAKEELKKTNRQLKQIKAGVETPYDIVQTRLDRVVRESLKKLKEAESKTDKGDLVDRMLAEEELEVTKKIYEEALVEAEANRLEMEILRSVDAQRSAVLYEAHLLKHATQFEAQAKALYNKSPSQYTKATYDEAVENRKLAAERYDTANRNIARAAIGEQTKTIDVPADPGALQIIAEQAAKRVGRGLDSTIKLVTDTTSKEEARTVIDTQVKTTVTKMIRNRQDWSILNEQLIYNNNSGFRLKKQVEKMESQLGRFQKDYAEAYSIMTQAEMDYHYKRQFKTADDIELAVAAERYKSSKLQMLSTRDILDRKQSDIDQGKMDVDAYRHKAQAIKRQMDALVKPPKAEAPTTTAKIITRETARKERTPEQEAILADAKARAEEHPDILDDTPFPTGINADGEYNRTPFGDVINEKYEMLDKLTKMRDCMS